MGEQYIVLYYNSNYVLLFLDMIIYSRILLFLGYAQGMSDICSVILLVFQNEVQAFWAFANLMNSWRNNFAENQLGMQRHFSNLASLILFMDPGERCYYDDSHISTMTSLTPLL